MGSRFALGAEPLTIGRNHSNRLHLRDLAVSRHHCILEPADDGWRVRDLDSLRGTFVNGVPIRERDLQPGDLLAVGNSLFRFEDNGDEPRPAPDIPSDTDVYEAESTVQVSLGASRYLGAETLPDEARTARDLHALLRIGTALHALRTTASLARRLLELTLETVPGQRAALLLLDRGADEPTSFFLHRRGGADPFRISRTLVQRVSEERSAALANDVRHVPDLAHSESLFASHVRSLVAAEPEQGIWWCGVGGVITIIEGRGVGSLE
jgi:pSer/pThr/pTyr-binding forkhead associated (FHA) protein